MSYISVPLITYSATLWQNLTDKGLKYELQHSRFAGELQPGASESSRSVHRLPAPLSALFSVNQCLPWFKKLLFLKEENAFNSSSAFSSKMGILKILYFIIILLVKGAHLTFENKIH